jgi:hypothetical protein
VNILERQIRRPLVFKFGAKLDQLLRGQEQGHRNPTPVLSSLRAARVDHNVLFGDGNRIDVVEIVRIANHGCDHTGRNLSRFVKPQQLYRAVKGYLLRHKMFFGRHGESPRKQIVQTPSYHKGAKVVTKVTDEIK